MIECTHATSNVPPGIRCALNITFNVVLVMYCKSYMTCRAALAAEHLVKLMKHFLIATGNRIRQSSMNNGSEENRREMRINRPICGDTFVDAIENSQPYIERQTCPRTRLPWPSGILDLRCVEFESAWIGALWELLA